ncbi:TPM domain-containing protein [Paenibacillus rubinfantis]|uniref:TPM domain-containing protein n=1 Tax=Paenibacillus rubinfantis TaxID=1720296 RepID=UPI00073EB2EE|nr:TPM domain-containing protein [Paenibacillus rubinfantis]
MNKRGVAAFSFLILIALSMLTPLTAQAESSPAHKKLIYDEAELLYPEYLDDLDALANEYGPKRELDIMVYTTDNPEDEDVVKLTEAFYDERAPGYDKAHGNAVILTLDMRNRDLYLAGFYKGEEVLDDSRLDKIRNKIAPMLTAGDYHGAFAEYIRTVYRYAGFRPGVNPDNLLFDTSVQLLIALIVGALVVGVMAFRSGGRVTVNSRTYEDSGDSGVIWRQDNYLRTTVTKTKIESSNNSGGGGSGGGGGGGGTTSGGHSHSGSRGSF